MTPTLRPGTAATVRVVRTVDENGEEVVRIAPLPTGLTKEECEALAEMVVEEWKS